MATAVCSRILGASSTGLVSFFDGAGNRAGQEATLVYPNPLPYFSHGLSRKRDYGLCEPIPAHHTFRLDLRIQCSESKRVRHLDNRHEPRLHKPRHTEHLRQHSGRRFSCELHVRRAAEQRVSKARHGGHDRQRTCPRYSRSQCGELSRKAKRQMAEAHCGDTELGECCLARR